MTCDIITALSDLRAIAPEWLRLVKGQEFATPFQLPDWLLTWFEHFGSGSLRVVVWRDAGELAGILPCFLHEWNGKRQLTLLGSGISDWTDPIVTPDMVDSLNAHLSADPDWDVIDWQDLSADTPLLSLDGVVAHADTPCSSISLQGDFDDYWAARSKDLRRNLRRYSERARLEGEVTFEVDPSANRDTLDRLFRLHRQRWQRQGQEGMVTLNRSEAFLRQVAGLFAANDMLRLFSVRFGRDIAAVVMSFPFRKTLYSYLSAFDPELDKLGFGRLLLFEATRWAYAEGYTAWNFLRGEEAYKQSWGAEAIPKTRLYRAR